MRLVRWASTVLVEIESSLATSFADRPSAMRRSTSRSRAESRVNGSGDSVLGERTCSTISRATAEAIKADVRNAFRVRNSNGDELQLAAIDRVDMDEWLAAVAETVADLRAAEDRVADQAERFKQESEN